jgi:Bacterial regulatory proteins, tetR family
VEERRKAVIEAAMAEFGEHGYHATSTAAIPSAPGSRSPTSTRSSPTSSRCSWPAPAGGCERIRRAFAEAARGTERGEARISAMGTAYVELL